MPPPSADWRSQLRYRFENTLSRGTIAIMGWLGLVSLLVVLLAALALMLLHIGTEPGNAGSELGFVEGVWTSLMHALDSGNLAGDQGWPLRLLMLGVTLCGIFIVSILIGTITSGLETQLTELRKGRSRVLEGGHTLILGWSGKVHSIIGELLIANANQKHACIVVLADQDKVEMEDDIRARFPDTATTRVICRRGNPLDLDDLEVGSPHTARSIIVLAPEIENPDIYVIKSVLALTNNPRRKSGPYHIVAEIRHERNLEAAGLVGGEEAVFVQGEDLIARVTAQTCRQSGLSVVYTELLDFDGVEIYFKEEPELVGRSYRQALVAYVNSAVMGIVRADGTPLINPPMDTVLAAGDQIIAISEDDDTLVLAKQEPPAPDRSLLVQGRCAAAKPERTLILGWNEKAAAIIRELDSYVAAGSEVVVVAQRDGAREQATLLARQLARQALTFADGDITSRAVLNTLQVPTFSHIILLSYTQLPMQEADAQTLIALLHLRNIAEASGQPLAIVSEMMDLRNRALAEVAKADDFIVSDKLASLMLSQLSENRQLDRVFRELFSAEGAEIYIRPIGDYVRLGVPVDFYTLIDAAAQRGETAIGYRRIAFAGDRGQGYGVRLNVDKREKVVFEAGDQIVVLAQE